MKKRVTHGGNDTKGIYLRNETYWLRYSRNGEQLRVSLKTADLAEAVKAAKAERARVPLNPGENLLGSVGRYINAEVEAGRIALRYGQELKARLATLLDFHPSVKELDDLNPKRLQEYLDLVRRKLSPASLNSYAGQLRGLFNILVERRHLRGNPMDEVRLPAFNQGEHVRENVVEPEVVRELLKKCTDPRLKFVLLAGFCLGMRKNEIVECRWGWFNLPARVCLIPPEARKRSKPACPPLNSEVIEHLKAMREALPKPPAPSDYVLEPENVQGAYRYRWDFRKPFTDFMRAHKVKCTAHDMRRTFCSLAARNGATDLQLSAWVGDTPRVLASHYSHLKTYNPLVEDILK